MRRFYNKGSLVGGQVKLDKMGNNDGKISGEDFAVIRSNKMGGGMMKRPMYEAGGKVSPTRKAKPKAARSRSKQPRKMRAGAMAEKKTAIDKINKTKAKYSALKESANSNNPMRTDRVFRTGKVNYRNPESAIEFYGDKGSKKGLAEKAMNKRIEVLKNNMANGGMMEEAKEINSKIKNSRTLKMGGGMMKRNMYKAGSGKDTHVTKDGRTVKKGLYYYMNRAKKKGTSKPGKGTVTDKALKASAKTAKKPTKKA